MQAGIPVAAKDLFMFLRETEALMAHALNQPLLQRIINALFIAVEVLFHPTFHHIPSPHSIAAFHD
jgi:hypothetical protein